MYAFVVEYTRIEVSFMFTSTIVFSRLPAAECQLLCGNLEDVTAAHQNLLSLLSDCTKWVVLPWLCISFHSSIHEVHSLPMCLLCCLGYRSSSRESGASSWSWRRSCKHLTLPIAVTTQRPLAFFSHGSMYQLVLKITLVWHCNSLKCPALCVFVSCREELNRFMESRGAAVPGIMSLTTSLSKPFSRLEKYSNLLKELQRHTDVCYRALIDCFLSHMHLQFSVYLHCCVVWMNAGGPCWSWWHAESHKHLPRNGRKSKFCCFAAQVLISMKGA